MHQHMVLECEDGIDWKQSGPIVTEKGWKERRVKESIETFKNEVKGKRVLNQCDVLHQSWKNVLLLKE